MMAKTHLAFAFLLSLIFIYFFRPENQILFVILTLVSSLLPDIDIKSSEIGKNFKIIGMIFKHRGIFHSLFFIILLIVLSYFFPKYILAVLIGYSSHVLLDCLNPKGITLFTPLSEFKINGFIRTGSLLEYIILGFILAIGVILLIKI